MVIGLQLHRLAFQLRAASAERQLIPGKVDAGPTRLDFGGHKAGSLVYPGFCNLAEAAENRMFSASRKNYLEKHDLHCHPTCPNVPVRLSLPAAP
jgi:hypothetical protein